MTQFEQAVDQVVEDSERLHKVVNGTASETVVTEDGSTIPTVRKALLDNLFFKTRLFLGLRDLKQQYSTSFMPSPGQTVYSGGMRRVLRPLLL